MAKRTPALLIELLDGALGSQEVWKLFLLEAKDAFRAD